MIALIGPWIISFGILVLIMAMVSNPWHPLFVFLYTFLIMSFIIMPIYLIYSVFFSKNSFSSKECEINIKIDEISKKTESLEKQQAIWDAEIQQLTNENNERQENLVYINQEIAMLTSSMIPFLPKNIKNK